jgi:DNA repair protein RadC
LPPILHTKLTYFSDLGNIDIVDNYLMPPVVKIQLIRETVNPYSISNPDDVNNILMQYLKYEDREHFVALLLDTKLNVNGIHTICIGDSESAIVTPREVFKSAILTNSCSIIVAHNHPSGDPTPSDADIICTKNLIQAGEILRIQVLDHVICGNNKFHSMKIERTLAF